MHEMWETICRTDKELSEMKIRLTFLPDWSQKTEHKVPRHFNMTDHRGIHDVEIHVLEFIKSNVQKPETKTYRLRSEYS